MLIQLNNISLTYGLKQILDGASATFSHNQKIAVIGRNGAGKSSLCKLIIGEDTPNKGKVAFASDLRLSYLEQKDPYSPDETVLDFTTRYSGEPEWKCAKIAAQFGLGPEHIYLPISALSGGFQMRVKLTAMMLREPNFLILDEPTNYLDLSTLLFLERFLQRFNGAFLIVSHDREFLKKTCDHTLEVENGKMSLYKGDVEAYLVYKEEQLEQKQAFNKNVERQKKHLQTFVDRFGSKAALAASAQSKRKQIDRLQTIAIDHPLSNVVIKMPDVPSKKGLGVKTQMLSIGYPDKTIASKINFETERGAHTAILGDNGQGKSTFLKTIAGVLKPVEGGFEWGYGMKIGYYAQHVYQELDENRTVVENLEQLSHPSTLKQTVLDMAGAFLFRGEDMHKKVSVLSGGERARLCLAGLLLSKCDVLLLDEPTNHLDFETVEALASSLREYKGTVFFISHDRTFVNILADSIVEVKDGKVQLYPGNYEEYVYHLEQEMKLVLGEDKPAASAQSGGGQKKQKKTSLGA